MILSEFSDLNNSKETIGSLGRILRVLPEHQSSCHLDNLQVPSRLEIDSPLSLVVFHLV